MKSTIYIAFGENLSFPYFTVSSGAMTRQEETVEALFENPRWLLLGVEPYIEGGVLVLDFSEYSKKSFKLLGTFPQDSKEEIRKRHPEHFL